MGYLLSFYSNGNSAVARTMFENDIDCGKLKTGALSVNYITLNTNSQNGYESLTNYKS